MNNHNSEYELGRQTENMDKSREWVKENDMNREQAHLITVADHKKIVSELEDNYRLSRECTETWKDTYFLAKDELSASQNRVKEYGKEIDMATDRYEFLNECCIDYEKRVKELEEEAAFWEKSSEEWSAGYARQKERIQSLKQSQGKV